MRPPGGERPVAAATAARMVSDRRADGWRWPPPGGAPAPVAAAAAAAAGAAHRAWSAGRKAAAAAAVVVDSAGHASRAPASASARSTYAIVRA